MSIFKNIKDNLSQILAITEKNIKLQLRYKTNLIFRFINPLISIILPIVILGQIFTFNEAFGPWDASNFLVYQLTTYQILLLYRVTNQFPSDLRAEKMWETLPGLIIAPFKRINLLIGIFFSYLTVVIIPIVIFFVICYIYYPISFLTVLSIVFLFFLMSSFFSGIGLIYGILAISKENYINFFNLLMNIILMFSCITLPFEFFPGYFQQFINLNPLYYVFNIVRMTWIENNIILSFSTQLLSFLIIIILGIISPVLGLFIFNFIYKKYGIAGY